MVDCARETAAGDAVGECLAHVRVVDPCGAVLSCRRAVATEDQADGWQRGPTDVEAGRAGWRPRVGERKLGAAVDEGEVQIAVLTSSRCASAAGPFRFANWAYEVAEQERQLGVFFDTIVVCSVTGSTQAGVVAGFAALAGAGGRPRRIVGIDASAKPTQTRDQISRIARDTAKLIGLDRELTDEEILLDERYHAGTYGIPDAATVDAMRVAARTEGMITDPVYERKSMAGLIDLVTRNEIPRTATVLYAHLGGQPALNAYSSLFS
ncbi:MAG TPA: pyridoxal-phosphate dependent enzyme [Pilimelia sp.]|nr:pyridoxal-phosphate dependent enzyme [Pilimelia sp.]